MDISIFDFSDFAAGFNTDKVTDTRSMFNRCTAGINPTSFFATSTDKVGVRTASYSKELTIHCTKQTADWLAKTSLRWIKSGYSGFAPIDVKFSSIWTAIHIPLSGLRTDPVRIAVGLECNQLIYSQIII